MGDNSGYIDPESSKSQAKLNLPIRKANSQALVEIWTIKSFYGVTLEHQVKAKANKFISAYERMFSGKFPGYRSD